MNTIVERQLSEHSETDVPTDGLFQVWIDVACGMSTTPDWWWNSPPKPLSGALDESASCRREGIPACILPEGQNPRPDGRWDNP